MIVQYGGKIGVFLLCWLAYRIYNLRYDIDTIRDYIARYITIHSIDSTPAYVDVCIHFISIGTAVYLISQLISQLI